MDPGEGLGTLEIGGCRLLSWSVCDVGRDSPAALQLLLHREVGAHTSGGCGIVK